MVSGTPGNAPKTVNDQKIKGMAPGCAPVVESLAGRGTGALVFKRPNESSPICYYRYHLAGKQVLIKLGGYRRAAREAGFSLPELRDKAAELARIAKAHGDVKAYLASLETDKEAARLQAEKAADAAQLEAEQAAAELARLAGIAAARGSFADLFLDYIEARRGKATPGVVKELERLFKTNLQQHTAIMAMKARDVRTDHILAVLNPIWERGSKVQAERMRSFLVAAFNHGLTAESVVGRANAKVYSLELNPAAMVKVEKVSAPVVRALSDTELHTFWETIGSTEGVGPVMALLFQFVIATGGQRIKNIMETTWDDYNLEAGTVRLMHRKGRGGQTQSRVHLVPLTLRAIQIIEQVRVINGGFAWPWTTNGKQHIVISSPTHAVADWLGSKHAVIEQQQVPSFSPRDLRRTCTQLMQKHGVDDRLSDLLQAHGQTGVVASHYRNNPEAALPEKRRAVELFDGALALVLGEVKERADNVVLLSSRMV
jgi:integrase